MSSDIIKLFKDSYRDMLAMDLSQLDQLYADNIVFKDPVHEIRGLIALQDYMAAMCANTQACQFEYLDQVVTDQSAYIKWNMHFRHPKLGGGKLITVRGVSQIQFAERIYYHEDIYDMGEMVYEHVPLVGGLTRWLKARLAD
ncbi:nuclear transport factor 2 family protein [Oceanicoccus sp. KOV_DT_Chl]|uniref:nuclear transport factor 2 family protein n=1 Tax=Oceanicoccus sp. KOV_DT_Chl TaxID=1904639 RepID=UPI000C7A0411|nr:nuclear transport factor 2 family protein [Oceanicoccus sp. KOV_DT_Chl]